MIVDCSLRPLYKSLAKMEVYQRQPAETFAVKIGMTPSAAAIWRCCLLKASERCV